MIHTTRLLERGTWHIMTDMFLIFYLASEAGSSLEGKFGEKNKHETSDTCLILLSDETMFNRMIFIHYSLELDHILG